MMWTEGVSTEDLLRELRCSRKMLESWREDRVWVEVFIRKHTEDILAIREELNKRGIE